ncbi:MAG: hypothetical protein LBU89_14915 [Fibromonadaceae bacterium]|jgi:hypothetical protein|nr:hypothetical protein [Fibromonadaceae bacterium]
MKTLKNIFLIFILCCVTGCVVESCCDDCTYSEEKVPAHTNESGVMVKIVAIDYDIYEKFIAHGDTLHSSFYKRQSYDEWDIPEWHFAFIDPYCDKEKNICNPIRIELHFLDDPQKCLIFDGPTEHDGFDIRSWDSYERGKKIPGWANHWAGIEYVYTITPEHRAMAKEEYCPLETDGD